VIRSRQRQTRRTAATIISVVGALAIVAIGAIALANGPMAAKRTGAAPGVATHAPRPATASAPAGPPQASPTSTQPQPSAAVTTGHGRFGVGLLIADRGNGRLLIVNDAKAILWSFPGPRSLPKGQRFSADDAFLAPDGKTIVANDEAHQVIDRIDIATRKVIWQYGRYDSPGAALDRLHTPDDAYPLANGDIVVADIRNCRILELTPRKSVARQWGRAGHCRHDPPTTFGDPNGDTPLADGGLLVTEIDGSRIVRLAPTGGVVFDIRAPVRYPSDAQLDGQGNIVVVDYSRPGAVLRIRPDGRVLWRYRPRTGPARLDHPSLALPLADGTIVLNDDFRHRVIVLDPRTNAIVWQYGRTDTRGRTAGYLNTPDGICLVPFGTVLPPTS
jgi:hypothetical protein